MFNLFKAKKVREEKGVEMIKTFESIASYNLHRKVDPFLIKLANAFNRQKTAYKYRILFFIFSIFLILIIISWKTII